jgi:uncharacterized protein (TIGR00730 family)
MEKSVCVFCASSTRVAEKYHDHARLLTKLLVKNSFEIKYGAGSVGLMGTVADTALSEMGKVTGVIPQFMVDREWAHKNISALQVVDNMHDRKRLMISGVEAVIALAGGIGTLDELLEVITLRQLGQFTKPIIIVNSFNFYNHLLLQLEAMVEEGFMRSSVRHLWYVANSPDDAMEALVGLKESDVSLIDSAQF